MHKEQKTELTQSQENPALGRAKELLNAVQISDYVFEEQADGIHFKIKTTPEHIEERRKQMATLDGSLKPTRFIREKIIPLKNILLQEPGLKFNFVGNSPEAGYIEIVISKK